jgi:hypothetical protein
MQKILLIIFAFVAAFLLSSCGVIPRGSGIAIYDVATEPFEQILDPCLAEDESHAHLYSEDGNDAERINPYAELTTLFAGIFVVGIDIPPGRYIITADSNGNLFVREGGRSVVSTILTGGNGRPHPSSVPSITTDIAMGQEIEIRNINNVIFTPATTHISTTLTAGDWVVGIDIPPGIYNAFPTYEEAGNFFVRSPYGRSVVSEILDTRGEGLGVERVRVNLEEGQRIQMHNISSVTFEQP